MSSKTYYGIIGGEGDTFVAIVPDLHRCIGLGSDQSEALSAVLEAFRQWFKDWEGEAPVATPKEILEAQPKVQELIAEGGKFIELEYEG